MPERFANTPRKVPSSRRLGFIDGEGEFRRGVGAGKVLQAYASPFRSSGTEFNMTAMIDVVFLLIIFFLVSSHLASQEVPAALTLPEAASAREARGPADRLAIDVLPDGTVLQGGSRVDLMALGRRLRRAADRRGLGPQVRIRCDRAARYRAVEPVLALCARAGISSVRFSVVRGETPLRRAGRGALK